MPQDSIRIPKKSEVEDILRKAREFFLANDPHLLEAEANERTLTHKFAEYIQGSICSEEWGDSWKVDCEYNRYGYSPKATSKTIKNLKYLFSEDGKVDVEDINARTVYPDIIVHKRGPKGPNLIIIEAKKKPCSDKEIQKDIKKLRIFKKDPKYQYKYAVFLSFNIREKSINWDFID